MESQRIGTPEFEADKRRRGKKLLFMTVVPFNLLGIAALTMAYMLFGEALIGSFIDPGTPQTVGRISWFLISLGGAICTMITIDAILAIVGIMGLILYAFFGKLSGEPQHHQPETTAERDADFGRRGPHFKS